MTKLSDVFKKAHLVTIEETEDGHWALRRDGEPAGVFNTAAEAQRSVKAYDQRETNRLEASGLNKVMVVSQIDWSARTELGWRIVHAIT